MVTFCSRLTLATALSAFVVLDKSIRKESSFDYFDNDKSASWLDDADELT